MYKSRPTTSCGETRSLVLGLLRVGHLAPLRTHRLAHLRARRGVSAVGEGIFGVRTFSWIGRARARGEGARTSPKDRLGFSFRRDGRRSFANFM